MTTKRTQNHSFNVRKNRPPERGFALIPLFVLLIILGTIATIMMVETVSALRVTAAARKGRALDIERRTATTTGLPPHPARSLSINPSAPNYQIIRYHRSPTPLSGIPLARYLNAPLPCPPSPIDPTTSRVCTGVSFNGEPLSCLGGGLHALGITVPETTRFLYARGTVRIESLTILAPSLTISALGSITIGSVSSPRRRPPTLLLLSRTNRYEHPTPSPGSTVIINGNSPLASSVIDTAVFPQPLHPIIGMRFPG